MLAGPLALALLSVLPETTIAAPIAAGDGQQTITVAGLDMTVFTYRPNCANPTLLLVFHGRNRNADRYREYARALADRLCMLVVAPRFDKERFPTWRYQRGGLVRRDIVQPTQEWSGPIVLEIVDWVRKQEGSNLDYSMIRHSAGGQFNQVVVSGTNAIHGKVYEYFQNRNLNALDQSLANAGITELPRFDNNRFGGQVGGTK